MAYIHEMIIRLFFPNTLMLIFPFVSYVYYLLETHTRPSVNEQGENEDEEAVMSDSEMNGLLLSTEESQKRYEFPIRILSKVFPSLS